MNGWLAHSVWLQMSLYHNSRKDYTNSALFFIKTAGFYSEQDMWQTWMKIHVKGLVNILDFHHLHNTNVPHIDFTIPYCQVTVICYGWAKSKTSLVFLIIDFVHLRFLVVSHDYKRVCPSVGPLVTLLSAGRDEPANDLICVYKLVQYLTCIFTTKILVHFTCK